MPKKYAHINFTPPQSVRAAARQGLKLHEDGKTGSGLEAATVAWARRIANGEDISPEKARQGNRFWGRNKRFLGFPKDSPAYASAMLWFGRPGQKWMAKLVRQMEAADMKNKSLATIADAILTVRGEIENLPQNGHFFAGSRPTPMAYKSEAHTGAMIALFLPADVGRKFDLIDKEALSPAEMHVTLAYLGKADELTYEQAEECHNLLALISDGHPPLSGTINGCGRFCNDEDTDPFFIIPDLAALPNLRQIVIDGLKSAGIPPASDHGFTPHVTLTYIPHDAPNPFDQITRTPVTFPTISLVLAGDRYDYQLKGGMGISKAALIEKIGARHTGAECAVIQKMHDLALDLGAECHPLTRRAGARHSHADRGMVQRIHDDCVGLGAECKALPVDEVYHSQVMKEQLDAPNYKAASTPQRCKNCKFLRGDPGEDFCTRFDFTADQDYVCDDWQAQRPDEIPGYVANKANLAALTEGVLIFRGGATSGNWGHSGRKGKRGGSGRGGGFGKIGVKPGANRKAIQQAASKSKKKVTSQNKPAATAKPKKETSPKKQSVKLDDIYSKAPKHSEKIFTDHLINKVVQGEISFQDAQALTKQFKDKKGGSDKAPVIGGGKVGKTYSEAELKRGDAKKEWDSWKGKLSTQERQALKAYSSEPFDDLETDYIKMNDHLRGKDKKPSKETREAIRQMDKAINRGSITQDTTVFRGLPQAAFGGDPGKMVGKTITDRAYSSTSLSERTANTFSRDFVAEIKVPKDSKGAYMDAILTNNDLMQLGRDPEHELVLPRGSRYRITGAKKVGKKTKVFMELING